MNNTHRFPYKWTLKNAVFKKNKGKVFSCFACGGGSTMGYKLAGFDVLGCNEIDPKMADAYKLNHDPKYLFVEPIQDFKNKPELPKELYDLDILDGSPPCSSFSMQGKREKHWGEKKKFREGQADQVLDTLFFDFIDLAERLQPKVVMAENVKGLMLGNAITYVRDIYKSFEDAGYYCQHWVLNGAKMGVPQRRERVFFVAFRKDLAEPFLKQKDLFTKSPELKLEFKEPEIPFIDVYNLLGGKESEEEYKPFTEVQQELYDKCKEGEKFSKYHEKGNYFAYYKINRYRSVPTMTTTGDALKHFEIPRALSVKEWLLCFSFPMDYNFGKFANNKYLLGMSVPPIMVAQIATQIHEQWLGKIKIKETKETKEDKWVKENASPEVIEEIKKENKEVYFSKSKSEDINSKKNTAEHIFPYKWNLKDVKFTKDKGKVFSCFACGGGSTMGYKLAGFDVLGCNEIDPKMMKSYLTNHNPKYSFLEGIQEFKERNDLPGELYDLDILDGSPPCSSFSMAGNREKDWGKEKKFREGQADQVLDTLFFDFIELAQKLRPKVVVAENVKGLMLGEAIQYVKKIYEKFEEAGYYCQHWLLNSAVMGVPQRRERVFFICLRKDLAEPFIYQKNLFNKAPFLDLKFNEKLIPFGMVRSETGKDKSYTERGKLMQQVIATDKKISDINLRLHDKNSGFNAGILHDNKVRGTITAGETDWRLCDKMACSDYDYTVCGTFPIDYDFCGDADSLVKYMVGMSVPPVMVAQIAKRIYEQWLSKIK